MLRISTFSALISLTVLAGCSPRTAPLRVDARHPASPGAPEGRPAPEWIGLQADEFDRAVAAAPAEAAADSNSAMPVHEEHGAPAHRQHTPSSQVPAPKAAAPSRKPSASARDRERPAIYACPMHPGVTDATASECPKCGMTLVQRKEKP